MSVTSRPRAFPIQPAASWRRSHCGLPQSVVTAIPPAVNHRSASGARSTHPEEPRVYLFISGTDPFRAPGRGSGGPGCGAVPAPAGVAPRPPALFPVSPRSSGAAGAGGGWGVGGVGNLGARPPSCPGTRPCRLLPAGPWKGPQRCQVQVLQ